MQIIENLMISEAGDTVHTRYPKIDPPTKGHIRLSFHYFSIEIELRVQALWQL